LPLYRRRLKTRGKNILPGESGTFTGKDLDSETGLYYYGARYLDPKTSRWLSADPAMGEYLPSAPISDEARRRNGNLPGMGGIFNLVNLHVYHYAGNNPVKYIDPDGREIGIEGDETNQKKILEWINQYSKEQYAIVEDKLTKTDGVNENGSKQYSDKINYLIENGSTTIKIGDTYTDEDKKEQPLPNDRFGNKQLGYTYGNNGLKIMHISITGESRKMIVQGGARLTTTPAQVIMHELAGHAEPRISGNRGNAVDIENSILYEMGSRFPSFIQAMGYNLRLREPGHSTHGQ
jgi:RHS repeat-associated protein